MLVLVGLNGWEIRRFAADLSVCSVCFDVESEPAMVTFLCDDHLTGPEFERDCAVLVPVPGLHNRSATFERDGLVEVSYVASFDALVVIGPEAGETDAYSVIGQLENLHGVEHILVGSRDAEGLNGLLDLLMSEAVRVGETH